MDSGTVIQRALEKLGDREYVENTATEDPVRRAYDIVVRRCNGRFKWSFARVTGRRLEVKERDEEGWERGFYVELPDSAPYFCEGVVCELAAEIAISIISNADLAAACKAEAAQNLQRAIDIDARQWKSNDQHPMRDIMKSNIFWH